MPYPDSPFNADFNLKLLFETGCSVEYEDSELIEKPLCENFSKLLKWIGSAPSVTTYRIFNAVDRNNLKLVISDLNQEDNVIYNIHPILQEVLIIQHTPNFLLEKESEYTHEIIVDTDCAAAVLRGSHIFAPGILGMTSGTRLGDTVKIYADVSGKCKRGLNIIYTVSQKIFIGIGIAKMDRFILFKNNKIINGEAIHVTANISGCPTRKTSTLPPGVLLQNFPSIVCVHVLSPKPGECILDMCASPGHKTTHIAHMMQNEGILIALDKTESKVKRLKNTCEEFNANVHVFLADSTKIVNPDNLNPNITDGPPFPREIFDKILLDAPCSGLGKRPQLRNKITEKVLKSYIPLQRKLFESAIQLLKPGGTLVYSTCTITAAENEGIVAWALKKFPTLILDDAVPRFGNSGYRVQGLKESQSDLLQRFGPDTPVDSVGFFIARFIKRI